MKTLLFLIFVLIICNHSNSQVHTITYRDTTFMRESNFFYGWELKDSLEDCYLKSVMNYE